MSATLIYDGECPLCRAARDWVAKRALPGRLEYLPCQADERAERFPGIPQSQCLEAMQLVTPEGTVYSGERALPELLSRLRGWRWVAWTLRRPPMSWVSGPIYGFIAKRRHAFTSVVGEGHIRTCSTDRDCK